MSKKYTCGRWEYLPAGHNHPEADSDGPTLMLNDGYGFDADRIKNDADLVHWVRHMAGKDWVHDEDLGAMVRLIEELRADGLMVAEQPQYYGPNECFVGRSRDAEEPKLDKRIEFPSRGSTYCRQEYGVYVYDEYPEGSVLEGQQRRAFKGSYPTLEAAQAAHPDAEVSEGCAYQEPVLPNDDE